MFEFEQWLLLRGLQAVGRRAEVVAGGYEGGFGDVRYSCRERRCQSRTKETTGAISQSHLIVYKKN